MSEVLATDSVAESLGNTPLIYTHWNLGPRISKLYFASHESGMRVLYERAH